VRVNRDQMLLLLLLQLLLLQQLLCPDSNIEALFGE
jgi:hypothetical protein